MTHTRLMTSTIGYLAAAVIILVLVPIPARASGPPAAKPPRKLALLVGISDYKLTPENPQPPEWWSLNCENDILRLKQILIERFKFLEGDILVLTDKAATTKGIEDAFRKHLIDQASPGDVVFFHYSGHGQQVRDDNGDEIDGLDESLVTAAYKSQSAEDAAKTNLRDDKIGDLLKGLKERMADPAGGKVKGNITVTFDCCFSGTATRGLPPSGRLVHRGRGWNAVIDGPPPPNQARGSSDEGSGLLERGTAGDEGIVVLTATRSNQTAKEWMDESGKPMGAFTLFFTQALDKATPKTTFRDVFEKINAELLGMDQDQSPMIEGDANNLLFSGTAVPPDPYLVVKAYDRRGGVVTLPVGELHGATVGSRFEIFRAGGDVKDVANRIATAEVTEVDSTTCSARLPEPQTDWPKAESMVAARAVEIEHNYGEKVLKVRFDGIDKPLIDEILKLKVVSTKDVTPENYDALIRPSDPTPKPKGKGEEPGKLVVEMKAGKVQYHDPGKLETPGKIRDFLAGEWRWMFVMAMKNDDPDRILKVDVRLVPIKVEVKNGKTRVLGVRDDVKPVGNTITLKAGDYCRLEVRNNSELRKAYISVLNLTPDGVITSAFPDDSDSTIFQPKPEWVPLPGYIFRTTLTPGAELENDTYKAIATVQETDFQPLLTPPAKQRGGAEIRGIARGKRGGKDHGLSRMIGKAILAEDPDPTEKSDASKSKMRGQKLTLESPDWDTADFIVRVTK